MLISTEVVVGCSVENGEGSVGTVHDLFFNDESWGIRYVVVSTGGWLSGRRILLPPSVVKQRDWPIRRLLVTLTRQQIKDSPDVDTHKPVSRQKELELDQYAAWTPIGGIVLPLEPAKEQDVTEGDSHLRSVKEVTGYHIEATDGEIGHVKELIVDDEREPRGQWAFRYLVVDTRNWLPGKQVLVAPNWAESVNWYERKVSIALTRQQIEGSPEYDPEIPVNRRFEEILYDYYGKRKYWKDRSV
jgi:hypothetical protein